MKKLWIKAVPWDKNIVTTALESGAEAVLVPEGFTKEVHQLGLIKTIAKDGDLKLGKDVVEREIRGKADEDLAIKLSKSKIIIVKTQDWTIIPLENLIAQTEGIIAEVNSAEEAKTALGILEKGVDGVLLNTTNYEEIKKTAKLIRSESETIDLKIAKLTKIKPLGIGDRVCIDTCTNMKIGEGMLIGNSSSAMFLIHCESIKNPYVEPRPFRVNAGPVHAYVKIPDQRTKYLSELKSGDETLIVNYEGKTEVAIVGRIKIERRPLMLLEAEVEGSGLSLILQNAETIRLVTPDGQPISVVKLKEGDEILVSLERAGRHFGFKVEETIVEK